MKHPCSFLPAQSVDRGDHLAAGHASSLLPDVATLSEQGWPEATFDAWYGFAVPVQVSASIQQRLISDIQAVVADPALQTQLRAQGMEPANLGQ